MGMDQWIASTNEAITKQVDFLSPEKVNIIGYHRGHLQLNNWMSNLYRKKGGKHQFFNCVNIQLTKEDLETLLKDIQEFNLSYCSFGVYFTEEEYQRMPSDEAESKRKIHKETY